MATRYFIDAYNVMHKSSLLRDTAHRDLERARDMLLDYVQCFCLSGDYEVTVVFDGREQEQGQTTMPRSGGAPRVHIVFSPHHTSADTVIERLIYQQTDRMNCIVVSNDRCLRDQCRGMGTLTMEPDSFLSSVRQVQRSARETLNKRQQNQAALLEDQLSEKNLDVLRALRETLSEKHLPKQQPRDQRKK